MDGHVISANKNSPKMTVTAGETAPVKVRLLSKQKACRARFCKRLTRSIPRLSLQQHRSAFSRNLTSGGPPSSLLNRRDSTRWKETTPWPCWENLAPQMASSVEWTAQIETMRLPARVFSRGHQRPKRALTVFAHILEGKPPLAVMTNHPRWNRKFPFRHGHACVGRTRAAVPDGASSVLTEAFRAGPVEAWASTPLRPVVLEDNDCARGALAFERRCTRSGTRRGVPTATVAPSALRKPSPPTLVTDLPPCSYPARFVAVLDLQFGLRLGRCGFRGATPRAEVLMATWTPRLHDSS